jgi:hypothetical protein
MILPVALMLMQAPGVQPVTDRCHEAVKRDGKTARRYVGDRACFHFEPQRLYTGIWIRGFEQSSFCEDIRDLRQVAGCKQDVWLSIDQRSFVPPDFKPKNDGRAYRIAFLGRRASAENDRSIMGYGHLGGSSGLVLVDRIVSWEDLGFPH